MSKFNDQYNELLGTLVEAKKENKYAKMSDKALIALHDKEYDKMHGDAKTDKAKKARDEVSEKIDEIRAELKRRKLKFGKDF